MARYFQIEPSWNCDLFDKRGRNLPGRIVVDTEFMPGWKKVLSVKNTPENPLATNHAIRDCFTKYLEGRYHFKVNSMSFGPVASRRGTFML